MTSDPYEDECALAHYLREVGAIPSAAPGGS